MVWWARILTGEADSLAPVPSSAHDCVCDLGCVTTSWCPGFSCCKSGRIMLMCGEMFGAQWMKVMSVAIGGRQG